ncbi:autotransporter secretion outer membrane protein TamA [Paucimonas lemoignei]|uniref:Autotransporter secretion outer membrane protein TamA n=1 Tax=Paucimonas lemoignei TaxID=29443 RepID=A0A4V2UJ31_PAULE|nr:autotransporter assembly complex family protein [Paucimonas lemoignei]TCS38460.1 autotransporter secretion outer membrane protein TamA [Paucimonas lemoignei]
MSCHQPHLLLRRMLCALGLLLSLAGPAHAYTVRLSGAGNFDELLERHLDIRRHQDDADMNEDEWRRLASITPQQIRELLATEGYFSPVITENMTTEDGEPVARFHIELGEPTTIDTVEIRFHGPVVQEFPQRIERLRRQWGLKQGERFTQAAWNDAKNTLLRGLLVRDYPAASITASQARIEPERRRAQLSIDVDSGPAFTFGELQVEGLQRYSRDMIDSLNPIRPGDRYSQEKLNELQSRLNDTGYFNSVFPSIDVDPAHPQQVPVKLNVAENPRKQLALGLGFSTDTGAGAQAKWLDRNFLQRGWRLQSQLEINRETGLLDTSVYLPVRKDGWVPNFNTRIERTNIANEINDKIRAGARMSTVSQIDERNYGIFYYADRQHLPDATVNFRQALMAGYSYTQRRLDNLINPRRGYVAGIEFGAGPKGLINEANIVRVAARANWLRPIDRNWQAVLRGETGQVFFADRREVPSDLLFRTGGGQTVRGYGYNTLGVEQGGAIVGGRVVAVLSAEIVYRITPQWGAALFHDAGNAADSWRDFKFRHGTGIGARWRSPIGPVNVDLAYGHATGQPQLHFSVGYVF